MSCGSIILAEPRGFPACGNEQTFSCVRVFLSAGRLASATNRSLHTWHVPRLSVLNLSAAVRAAPPRRLRNRFQDVACNEPPVLRLGSDVLQTLSSVALHSDLGLVTYTDELLAQAERYANELLAGATYMAVNLRLEKIASLPPSVHAAEAVVTALRQHARLASSAVGGTRLLFLASDAAPGVDTSATLACHNDGAFEPNFFANPGMCAVRRRSEATHLSIMEALRADGFDVRTVGLGAPGGEAGAAHISTTRNRAVLDHVLCLRASIWLDLTLLSHRGREDSNRLFETSYYQAWIRERRRVEGRRLWRVPVVIKMPSRRRKMPSSRI